MDFGFVVPLPGGLRLKLEMVPARLKPGKPRPPEGPADELLAETPVDELLEDTPVVRDSPESACPSPTEADAE